MLSDKTINPQDTLLHSSLAMLALQAEVSELKSQNAYLEIDNRRLKTALDESEEARLNAQIEIKSLQKKASARAISGKHHNNDSSQHFAPRKASNSSNQRSQPSSANAHASSSKVTLDMNTTSDFELATRLQLEYSAPQTAQDEYAAEHARLVAERQALIDANSVFTCGICLDTASTDTVAVPIGCDHPFCRDCLKKYVQGKLQERRFSMVCPTCAASGDGQGGV